VSEAARIRVWDLPTRIFHWALVALAVFSFTTGTVGGDWMAWHLRSGYTVLALLLFRILWGFAGSTTSRFAHFVRRPRLAIDYGRRLLATRASDAFGHNPLGGWMIVAMLAAFLVQAASGLFADDEISTQGPLAVKVSNATVERLSALHSYNQWVLVALAALHVTAIATYAFAFRTPLVGAMVHGWSSRAAPGAEAFRAAPLWRAVVLAALSAGFVYWLVVVFPRG
jgi:cytochrome b